MKNFILLLLPFCFASCTKTTDTKPSFTETEGTVTGISVTNTANIGQDVTVKVNYNGAQSCDLAGHIERAQVGKTITVHPYYKHPSTNDPCLDSPAALDQTFIFKPLQTGQFIFKAPGTSSVGDTLNVL
jgi:hypothetical protein